MIRTSDIHLFKKLASKNFTLKDSTFVGFTDIGRAAATEGSEGSDSLVDKDVFDLVAEMKLGYTGNPPESYRVLNSMIMDWVDSKEADLKKTLNPVLKNFLIMEYPEVDTSALDEDFDDFIWEDQVDYHPQINEEDNSIYFTLELVLSVEEEEQDD